MKCKHRNAHLRSPLTFQPARPKLSLLSDDLMSDKRNVPHPIPYQGSKRNLASAILRYFPATVETLHEPFAGSAAISLAAAAKGKANWFHINDLNKPLIDLWQEIVNSKISCGWVRKLRSMSA